MSSTRAGDRAAEELRQLVTLLERSGMAESRPDVRALLNASRQLLRGPPPARLQPSPRKLLGKFAALGVLALDLAMAGLVLRFTWLAMANLSAVAWIDMATLPFALIYALLRVKGAFGLLHEALFCVRYYFAWGRDWFGEAFSIAALERLSAKLTGREVMWGWRRHRGTLPHRASLADVESFLSIAYCARAAREFRRSVDALHRAEGWTLRGGAAPAGRSAAAERLVALRWSALIKQFEALAASGLLWPEAVAELTPASLPPLPQSNLTPLPEPPERLERRRDLREIIRRKRQDITAAYGWKLKTAAEIEQRDAYLLQTRAEITALEKELAELGR